MLKRREKCGRDEKFSLCAEGKKERQVGKKTGELRDEENLTLMPPIYPRQSTRHISVA